MKIKIKDIYFYNIARQFIFFNKFFLFSFFIFIFYFSLLFASSVALAAPVITSISGTLTTGSTVTITGSGFGTKATAAPLKYDAFESGTAGQDLGNGWVFSTSDDRNPKYSAKFLRPNSIMSGMADFSGNQYLSSFGVQNMTSGYPEVYMDFWYLYDPASPQSRNHKLFRFYTGFDSGQPDRYMNVFCGTGWTMESDGGGTSNWYGSPWQWTNADKQWSHFQGYFKTNTDGASNGIIKFWIDSYKFIDASNWVHRPSGSSVWRSLWFGNYLGHDAAAGCGTSPGNSYTFWDNVYLDTTQARVEIGNNANYESSTHREIQIPSAWSDGSINYTVNNGSFTSGQQAYLFVFDSNGVVNASGYPITIGGAPVPDTTAPSIPTNLSATAISSSQINLSWTASTDAVGVSGYNIYRGGVQIDTAVGTSYSDIGLSADTSYSYTVSAYDAAGNVSGQSGSTSAVTLSAPSGGSGGSGYWELTASFESSKYKGIDGIAGKDGGTSFASFEIGNDLKLTPLQVEEFKRDSSLVGYWPFDEGSGITANDSSGNGNNGTLYNNPTQVSGEVNGALSFNGTNNYVRTSSEFSAIRSIGVWVYPTTANQTTHLVHKNWKSGVTNGYDGRIHIVNGRPNVTFANTSLQYGGSIDHSSSNVLPINTWSYIVGVVDGSGSSANNIYLYVNGALDGQIYLGGTLFNQSSQVSIGAAYYAGFSNYFNGLIDDVRIYNRALSAAEIMAIYNATK